MAGILRGGEGPVRRLLKRSPNGQVGIKQVSDILFRELTTAIETSKALQAMSATSLLWVATEITKPLVELQEKLYNETKKWEGS